MYYGFRPLIRQILHPIHSFFCCDFSFIHHCERLALVYFVLQCLYICIKIVDAMIYEIISSLWPSPIINYNNPERYHTQSPIYFHNLNRCCFFFLSLYLGVFSSVTLRRIQLKSVHLFSSSIEWFYWHDVWATQKKH